jgi:hypothetical protein
VASQSASEISLRIYVTAKVLGVSNPYLPVVFVCPRSLSDPVPWRLVVGLSHSLHCPVVFSIEKSEFVPIYLYLYKEAGAPKLP